MDNKAIPLLLEEWNGLKEELQALYTQRDQKHIPGMMKKGIDLYVQFLFWSNDQEALPDNPGAFAVLEYKPVNIEERLAFIQARPALYHSFRQLSELMTEQEKLYVKKKIMKKASSHKG